MIKILIRLRFRPLATRPIGDTLLLSALFVPWVFITLLGKNRDQFVLVDPTLANRAYECLPGLLKPLVNAFPAIKMATLRYYWLFGRVQADIAFEHT